MTSILQLETERLIIRDLAEGDLQAMHELNSLPETDEYNTLGLPENLQATSDLMQDRIARNAALPRSVYVMAIVLKGNQEMIGMIGINLAEPKKQRAEVWYKLHKNHWRKGYTAEALQRLLQYAFEDLKLHRIEAGCATENIASIKVLEKVGMQREGRCRKILPIRGAWVDNYMYAILEADFAKLKN